MSADRTPVTGRFYPASGPGFVTLDVSALVDNNVHELLELLGSDEFFEDFVSVACAEPAGEHDGSAPDRLAFEELKDRLIEQLATRVAMTGRQARRVGAQVYRLGAQLSAEADAADTAALSAVLAPKQQDRRAS
ncbi:hypothetical protein OG195_27460 [Streptomyces sp. NBC_01362]|uniref:hypothetical protein n=1 Tax=Streptomyces sp. NBC_01362 TaxID=2903839 RepID=UPI002E3798B8|nr:hypothetical protein [Streptomyces sp. NBC_01362]